MSQDSIRQMFDGKEPATLVELLAFRARRSPDRTAYTFVSDREDANVSWTYSDLERRAHAIAAALSERRVGGRPVLLLYPQGLEYIAAFLGCLCAGAIAVPAYPPDPKNLTRTLPRLQAIIEDAGTRHALTTTATVNRLAGASPMSLELIATDELPDGPEAPRAPASGSAALAFLQYTSGSTATPKGVMVSHANLLHNLRAISTRVELDHRSHVVSWLPAYHDMGLIGGILQPLYAGSKCTLMAPLTFLKRPFRWLDTISRVKATTSVAPNFAYDLCVRKITAPERDTLDLRSWRWALTGAEPVRASTLDAFGEFFGPAGFQREAFYPCYGLAEGTLMIAGGAPHRAPTILSLSTQALERQEVQPVTAGERATTLVSAGQATPQNNVRIVDPATGQLAASGRLGEIWVAGPSVARGYWRRREESERTFRAQVSPDDGARYLRTGDLGFIRDGHLFIAGRMKDVLIVRGRNVHPHDIEHTVQRVAAELRADAGAAFSIELQGREEVIVAQEVEPRGARRAQELMAEIRRAVAEEHELAPHAVLLLKAGSIPKTTSGKIRRGATKQAMKQLALEVVAASVTRDPHDDSVATPEGSGEFEQARPAEKRRMAETWLRDEVPASRESRSDTTLAHLGVTYPDLYEMALRARRRLGVQLPLGEILADPTTAALLEGIAPAPKDAMEPASGSARSAQPRRTEDEIRSWLVARIASTLGLHESVIDVTRPFQELGLDSAHAVSIADSISVWLGRPVAQTLVWDHPTVQAVARALGEKPATAGAADGEQPARSPPNASADDGIAIVGVACRFPGAPNVAAFWRLIHDGRDAVSEVPQTRWNIDALHDPAPGVPGKMVTRWGAFLDRIDAFDAPFFSMSLREAARVDPQQRLLLETTWEALENAGEAPDRIAGSDTGVFVGISSHDYGSLQLGNLATIDSHTCTGNAQSIAANRISYVFDLHGPSVAVDTACSASLVAVHQACESLRRGECSRALVGGVNLMITPHLSVAFSQSRMLAPDGRCKAFDDSADGYVRGEGCGVVVLKRLADAIAAGDQVLAVIAGSAINHDGRSNGLTAPNGTAQRSVIRRALDRAQFHPHQVSYVEAHGTGTSLGDPIEFDALADVYGAGRSPEAPCLVGSVKTNIGHLEAAAGIAGLIKATLAISKGEVPAHLHLKKPNERMRWKDAGLRIAVRTTAWAEPRVAAVSSFGFGGANAHIVLRQHDVTRARSAAAPTASLLALSARSEGALQELARRYAQHLQAHHDEELRDVCCTAGVGRSRFAKRLAIVARSGEELQHHLRGGASAPGNGAPLRGEAKAGAPPRVAFLFTGQGAQYASMGRALHDAHPGFRETLAHCDTVLRPLVGESVLELLFSETSLRTLRNTRFQQPAMFALQIALARMLESWGIQPDAVLGHSLGEYAAACLAGVFSLDDGLRLVAERGRLMDAQPLGGGMLACLGDAAIVTDVAREAAARGEKVAIAAWNAPRSVVIAGENKALERIAQRLETQGLTTKRLDVSHAFHSPLMAGALDAFEAAASAVRFNVPAIPVVSNVTGEQYSTHAAPDARYWRRHLREAVQFEGGVRTLLARGCDMFIEIGPGTTLVGLVRAIAAESGPGCAFVPTLQAGKDEWMSVLEAAARVFVAGGEVDWNALYAPFDARRVALPTYPFERARVWLDGAEATAEAPRPAKATNGSRNGASHVDATSLESLVDMFQRQGMALSALASATGKHDVASVVEQQLQAVAIPTSAPSTSSRRANTDDAAKDVVLRHVAAVSGFARDHIPLEARLGADLGFDSLMKSELDRRIVRECPQLSARDRRILPEDPRVADVVSLVTGSVVVPQRDEPPPSEAHASNGTALHTSNGVSHVQQPTLDFESWPEVHALAERFESTKKAGGNPYGRIHESKNSGSAEIQGRKVANFAAFNYLALSSDPQVCEEAKRAIERYGTSTSATPLLFGETPLHHLLENELARFLGTEAAIVFASGHATNVATVGHLFGPEDLIVHDQLIHDSTVRGAMLSGAKRRPFRHNDWRDLDRILAAMRGKHRRAVIVLEGVYSQDGDYPDLPRFVELRNKYDAMLMVDEAHSLGVMGRTGRGIGEHFGVDRRDVDLWMGTLSKALGSCGGYIAARAPIVRYLKYTTPLFIFSTGISPANAAAALAGLRVLWAEPHRVQRVQDLSRRFTEMAHARGLDTGIAGGSAIVPIIVGEWERTLRISNALLARGINAMPIGYPAVAKDACRLRFFLNFDHTEEDMKRAIDAVSEEMGRSMTAGVGPSGSARSGTRPGTADVLVTGATGFIGAHLAKTLLERGNRVRVLVRESSDQARLPATGVEVVHGTLENEQSVRAAMHGVRVVYNCAGLSADWGPWQRFHDANVKGVENLLEEASKAGTVERFLHLSTSDVYGYPQAACDESAELKDVGLPYNRSKVLGEQLVWEAQRRTGLPVTVLRPVTVFGPRSKDWVVEIANLLIKGQMMLIDGGRSGAGLIYIDDVVEAILAAAHAPGTIGQAYNLRHGASHTWRQYADALAEGLGAHPARLSVPSAVALGLARASEAVYAGFRVKSRPLLTRHAVYLLSRDQSYPVDKAKRDFRFEPSVSFERGIERTLSWLGTPEGRAAVPRLS